MFGFCLCLYLDRAAASYRLQKLKEKEAALTKAEQSVVSRDRVINELRLRLPAAAGRERLLAELARQEEVQPDGQPALQLAHQSIKDLQGRLDKKEDVLKKCQSQLAQARRVRPHCGSDITVHFFSASKLCVKTGAVKQPV